MKELWVIIVFTSGCLCGKDGFGPILTVAPTHNGRSEIAFDRAFSVVWDSLSTVMVGLSPFQRVVRKYPYQWVPLQSVSLYSTLLPRKIER
ncbi:hypothetical protein PanWU01x14_146370 [Parasponia andersonii]|uniref:Secreted protein n=1 Tax=Parasponia andersonii TaxID=3476 RepID=A0A2P5CJM7_PARAD|nr:hypothetical protein PanWU01x14_146370 [Parasponia andersonii]